MSEPKTYDCFVLHSLMPAPGWQAVYDMNGTHKVAPLYALALATRRSYYCQTVPRQQVPSPDPEDEMREIVGLDYDPGEGFTVWDQISNYCGLLPPGMTLEAFAEASRCRYRHAA